MNEKSFVTMEQHQCPICLSQFDTGALLLDRRMREQFDRYTMTGLSPCPDCQKQLDDDMIALVEVTPESGAREVGGKLKPEHAVYSGRHCFLRRRVALEMFDIEPQPVNYCDGELLDMLESMAPP